MKHFLLITAMLLSFTKIEAQNFQPINTADTAGVWSVWDEKFFFLGDSTFDGKQYKKLFRNDDSVVDVQTRIFEGLFREDNTGKAWLRRPNSTEGLLHDISANQGDTLQIHPLFSKYHVLGPDPDSSYMVIVEQVDTVNIGGVARRRLAINNLPLGTALVQYEYWIEGIGSTAGLPYSAQGNQIAIISWSKLLCYQENGQMVYFDPSFIQPVCYLSPLGIEENTLANAVKLSPNPATDFINIELSLPNLQNAMATVRLFNLAGQILINENLQFDSGSALLDLKSLGATGGVYVLEIKTNDFVIYTNVVLKND